MVPVKFYAVLVFVVPDGFVDFTGLYDVANFFFYSFVIAGSEAF